MSDNQKTYYLRLVTQEARNTEQSLREVKARAEQALERMKQGGRPGVTRALLGQPASDAEHYAARLGTLLDLASVLGVDDAEIAAAYKAGA